MIVAVAGRRIDAPEAATTRFPLANAAAVRARLLALFRERGATEIVTSAACGADLLALDAARALGMRLCVVLPFDRATFREQSVTDRPGDWGPLYDELCDAAEIVEMGLDPAHGQEAYEAATLRILDEAGPSALAVAVSDGASRGAGDLTVYFVERARARGLEVVRVDTLH